MQSTSLPAIFRLKHFSCETRSALVRPAAAEGRTPRRAQCSSRLLTHSSKTSGVCSNSLEGFLVFKEISQFLNRAHCLRCRFHSQSCRSICHCDQPFFSLRFSCSRLFPRRLRTFAFLSQNSSKDFLLSKRFCNFTIGRIVCGFAFMATVAHRSATVASLYFVNVLSVPDSVLEA